MELRVAPSLSLHLMHARQLLFTRQKSFRLGAYGGTDTNNVATTPRSTTAKPEPDCYYRAVFVVTWKTLMMGPSCAWGVA
ncbi:hypothetical protein ABMB68_005971 [Bradyrhizobium sp. RT4a]